MGAPGFAVTIADLLTQLSRTPSLCPELMILWTCWPVNNGSLTWTSGYWQVSLSREARAKTVFATHSGLFQFKVMPFGHV